MSNPCDDIKNMANTAAAAADNVRRDIIALNNPTAGTKEYKKEKALERRFKALRGIYNALVQLYTMDKALGGCGGDKSDVDPFPSPPVIVDPTF
ncbi:MAG: hypothetical protein AAFR28_09675 [Pseudomonadota bacterium]